jgi:hypothetical protein
MPFVSWCEPQARLQSDDDGDFCAVRVIVGFHRVSPDDAVFTTRLPGILAFSIR